MGEKNKLPAFQFYPGDWRKDPGVQALDFYTRGVWFEILLLMHESDERGFLLLNGKPMPEKALANLLGIEEEKTRECIAKLVDYGVVKVREKDKALFNRRMFLDEKLRKVRKKCGEKGGKPVKNEVPESTCKNEGLPVLLRQNVTKSKPNTKAKANQNVTPSSSSSTSILSTTKVLESLEPSQVLVKQNSEVPKSQLTKETEIVIFDEGRQCVSSGRYPLKKYQFLFLHEHELRDAREQWLKAGLTQEDWRNGLKRANVECEGKSHQINFRGGIAYKYLTTHILTEALEQTKKKNQINNKYQNKPEPNPNSAARKIFKAVRHDD